MRNGTLARLAHRTRPSGLEPYCTAVPQKQELLAMDPTRGAMTWIGNTEENYVAARRIARNQIGPASKGSTPTGTELNVRANKLRDWMEEVIREHLELCAATTQLPFFVTDIVEAALASIDYRELVQAFGEE